MNRDLEFSRALEFKKGGMLTEPNNFPFLFSHLLKCPETTYEIYCMSFNPLVPQAPSTKDREEAKGNVCVYN